LRKDEREQLSHMREGIKRINDGRDEEKREGKDGRSQFQEGSEQLKRGMEEKRKGAKSQEIRKAGGNTKKDGEGSRKGDVKKNTEGKTKTRNNEGERGVA